MAAKQQIALRRTRADAIAPVDLVLPDHDGRPTPPRAAASAATIKLAKGVVSVRPDAPDLADLCSARP
jgi:hypothetical protein